MIRRLWSRLWRREPSTGEALDRALDADAARGGTVADLGDVLSGRVPLPSVGEAAPDWGPVNDVLRTPSEVDEVIRRLYPTRQPAREVLPLTWRQRQDLIELCERIPNGPEVAR